MGERTRPAAVEVLAERLFAGGAVDRVIAVVDARAAQRHAPRHGHDDGRRRRVHHLPRHPAGARALRAHAGPERGARGARATTSAPRSREALDVPGVRFFETGGDRYEAEREQWDDGNNVLAVAPGRRRRLRAQRRHQHAAAPRGHRGHHDRRRRARAAAAAARAACPARSSARSSDDHRDPGAQLPARLRPRAARAARAARSRGGDARRPDRLARRRSTARRSRATSPKPSTRTRVSFEAAAWRLGMLPVMLRPDELQLGRGEPLEDTARVLSRYAARARRAHVRAGGPRRARGGRVRAGHQRAHRRPPPLPGARRPAHHARSLRPARRAAHRATSATATTSRTR